MSIPGKTPNHSIFSKQCKETQQPVQKAPAEKAPNRQKSIQDSPEQKNSVQKPTIQHDSGGSQDAGKELLKENRLSVSKSKRAFDVFKVLLHNDSRTPMHFVVQVLRTVFHVSSAEAHAIMYEAHVYGVVVVGVFPKDVADDYILNVRKISSFHGYSLRCSKVEL